MDLYKSSSSSPPVVKFDSIKHHFEVFGFSALRIEGELVGPLPKRYVVRRVASVTWLVNTAAPPVVHNSERRA
jgi:hypothetical protein